MRSAREYIILKDALYWPITLFPMRAKFECLQAVLRCHNG